MAYVARLVSSLSFRNRTREEKVRFVMHLVIGAMVIVLLQFLENTDFGESAINRAFDHVLRKEASEAAALGAGIMTQIPSRVSPSLAFIDLEAAYRERGAPSLTPRDVLARAISGAARGGAKVIVLDILLEDPDCCQPRHDDELKGVLQTAAGPGSSAQIILPVRVGRDGQIRDTIFDTLLDGHENFHRAIPFISATASDRVVRYWVPYEVIQGESPGVLWNVSFLAVMLAQGRQKDLPAISDDLSRGQPGRSHSIRLEGGSQVEVSGDREDIFLNRIRFFLVPRDIMANAPAGNVFTMVNDAEEAQEADFRDKIVIIGNSALETGDVHVTPAGTMPGMYIIGNVANTLLLGLQPAHPSVVLNVLIELVVLVISAYFLSRLPPLAIRLIKGMVLISALSALSYYYFIATGVLLNVAFAVAGMGFHDTALAIEKALSKRRVSSKGGGT